MRDKNVADPIELSDAIEALRDSLVKAWWDGQNKRVRFRIEPVDLTIHVGVTRVAKGEAGIKWHVLALGGEGSRTSETTQTLKMRLAPLVFDDQGRVLADSEQLISGREDKGSSMPKEGPAVGKG